MPLLLGVSVHPASVAAADPTAQPCSGPEEVPQCTGSWRFGLPRGPLGGSPPRLPLPQRWLPHWACRGCEGRCLLKGTMLLLEGDVAGPSEGPQGVSLCFYQTCRSRCFHKSTASSCFNSLRASPWHTGCPGVSLGVLESKGGPCALARPGRCVGPSSAGSSR